MNLYFETSGINYLFDKVFNNNTEFSSVETKKLQLEKGRKWYISNIGLWEIFLTKNKSRRYELFDFSRCLFYDSLMPSPEEIIINYIRKGCPTIENRFEFTSNSLFSSHWTEACSNLDYFFSPDPHQIEDLTKYFRLIGDYLIKIKRGGSPKLIETLSPGLKTDNVSTLNEIYLQLLEKYKEKLTEEAKYYVSVSLQMTMFILCYGIGFDQKSIEKFWEEYKIPNPLKRLVFVFENFRDIFYRGPISNITKMIMIQAQSKSGRGAYFDSLHSIYTTYADIYITNDQHFLDFKNDNLNDPNMNKVVDIKDLEFFKTEK